MLVTRGGKEGVKRRKGECVQCLAAVLLVAWVHLCSVVVVSEPDERRRTVGREGHEGK